MRDIIDQLIENLYNEIASLKDKLWEVQKKDVSDIEFFRNMSKRYIDKNFDKHAEIYNLKEKIRSLESPGYEPNYLNAALEN